MKYLILIFSFCFLSPLLAQVEVTVKPIAINTNLYDEFAPTFFNNNLIISSNRKMNLINTIIEKDQQGNEKFLNSLFLVGLGKDSIKTTIKPLEINLPETHNGPASFSPNNLLVIARNQVKNKRTESKIGLFFYTYDSNTWSVPTAFVHNSTDYNISHPSINEDGTKLYCVSDKDGGYGGMDIWYSLKDSEGNWGDLINCGKYINSPQNEVFPTTNNGILYFSTNQQSGFGGYDIYSNSLHNQPSKPLEKPINSTFDDYSYTTNDGGRTGFLVSNRDKKNDNIYLVKRKTPSIADCQQSHYSTMCYTFTDKKILPDSMDTPIRYVWDFGDGSYGYQKTVKHCYQSAGQYKVKMSIIDPLTGINNQSSKILTINIEPNSDYHIAYHTADSLKKGIRLRDQHQNNKSTDSLEIFWKINNKVYFDQEEFQFKPNYYGEYVVQSFIKIDTAFKCVADTIYLQESDSISLENCKIQLVYRNESFLESRTLQDQITNCIQNYPKRSEFKLLVSESTEIDEIWKEKMKSKFNFYFDKELTIEEINSQTLPLLLIYE